MKTKILTALLCLNIPLTSFASTLAEFNQHYRKAVEYYQNLNQKDDLFKTQLNLSATLNEVVTSTERSSWRDSVGTGAISWTYNDNGILRLLLFPLDLIGSRRYVRHNTTLVDQNPQATSRHGQQVQMARAQMQRALESYLVNNVDLIVMLKTEVAWAYKNAIEIFKSGRDLGPHVMAKLDQMSRKIQFTGTVTQDLCVTVNHAAYTDSRNYRETMSFGIFTFNMGSSSRSTEHHAFSETKCSTVLYGESVDQNQTEMDLVNLGEIDRILAYYKRYAVMAYEILPKQPQDPLLMWNSPFR